jgi:hypothetical protein
MLAMLMGCHPALVFTCTDDDACRRGGTTGICQASGYCSFVDSTCPSGQRYVEESAPALAGTCAPMGMSMPPPGSCAVLVTSPAMNATVGAMLEIRASTSGCTSSPIDMMLAYLNSNPMPVCGSSGPSLACTIAVPAGAGVVNVNAWDSTHKVYTSEGVHFTSAQACTAGVTITQPADGASVGATLMVSATAASCNGKSITGIKAYLNDGANPVCSADTPPLSCSIPVPIGTSHIDVHAWDALGTIYKDRVTFTH